MEKQVDKNHYDFTHYSNAERWMSYYHQIEEVIALKPRSVLEVGLGGGIFRDVIKDHTDIEYKSIDIAEDINPDIVGSVDNMPLRNNEFDLVCAFEILEHLPFEKFEECLKEIRRVASKGAIISLPHFGPPVKLRFKLPFLPEVTLHFKVPYAREHKFNGEHYWEIGKKGYSRKKVRNIFSKYFTIKKEFVAFDNQYHRFYVLENK